MKKHAITHWPLWAAALALLVIVGTVSMIGHFRSAEAAAGSNVTGIYLTDNGQSSADCSHRDQDGPANKTNFGSWLGWTGDSDNYDSDCVEVFAGTSIPPNSDFRIGLQAQDVNTPCGFLWLFKCGDGGGSVVWSQWVSSSTGKDYANIWTPYASDADAWDPDQWRVVYQASSTAWYGRTVTDFKVGVQVADTPSGGGCSGQVGTVRYTASSTAGGGWTTWAADNVDNQNFNCMRFNLIATTTLNDPTAAFIGTSTSPYGDTINLPWDVEYINTTAGCTITSPQDPTVRVVHVNGIGSTTTTPILGDTTYTITCPGLKGGTSVMATKLITTISQPASLEFNMSPVTGLDAGATTTVYITAINAASCSLVGKDVDGNVVDDGTAEGYPYTPPPPSTSSLRQVAGGTFILINAGSTWKAPDDWDSTNNTVEAIGGGGGGQYNAAGTGGGGAYSKGNNVVLVPGSTITYSIGGGGSGGGGGGGDTWFNATSMANCVSAGPTACVGAKGGSPGGGGAGGQASAGVGTVKYSGGNGGSGNGGGGGAAGPYGNGNSGASASPGSGGAGDAGSGGGGGGASSCSCENYGGAGGSGTEWNISNLWNGSTYSTGSYIVGSGGGGGGATADCGQYGCNWGHGGGGGAYGGGGGSSFSATYGGNGSQGLIIVGYKPAAPFSANVVNLTTSDSGDWIVPDDWNSSNNTIELWGGGGGGGGDGTGLDGAVGATTTFNVTLKAGGGGKGLSGSGGYYGGPGGLALGGNTSNYKGSKGITATATTGGAGGSAPFGGAGGTTQSADADGYPGTGPGGGGGGGCSGINCGSSLGGGGGGGGGYVISKNVVLTPGTHITYQVGAGGAGGADTSVRKGGAGADGKILITNNPPPDAADAHTSTHTVNSTTDYTVTCTPYFSGEPTVFKTVRVNLSSCLLDGVTVPNGGSANFYSRSTSPNGHTCSEYGPAVRSCTGGQLDTTNTAYKYATCLDQTTISLKANNISSSVTVRKGANVAISWDGGNSTSCNLTSSSAQSSVVIPFTASGSWTVPTGVTSVQALVVAGGGGGGGSYYGGGGGGGGFVYNAAYSVVPGTNITVTVGGGGAGGTAAGNSRGSNGSNSVFDTTGTSPITAIGGGGGGAYNSNPSGLSGGSGGGSSLYSPGVGGTATLGQGNAGGTAGSYSILSASYGGGAGGGGAGAAGSPDVYVAPGSAGAGGAGLASSISGSSVMYAGGGGGGSWSAAANGGAGGSGGGGAGGKTGALNGVSGTANTGGGGGGANTGTGGAGGSGIVIISYDPTSGTSGGLSSTDITGTRSVTVTQKTIFTLSCSLGSSTQQVSTTVNLVPTVIEI